MRLSGKTVGLGISGSHCSYDEVLPQVTALQGQGARVVCVLSESAATTDTRFTTAQALKDRLERLTGTAPVTTIVEAEPLGQKKTFDVMVIAPCTGNTMAKLANAITDSPVLMAAKGTLRNQRPVVLGISTNDALGGNALNLALLLTRKHVFMIPFGQDNPEVKPTSLVSDMDLLVETVVAALEGRQLQPVLIERAPRPVR